MMKNLPSGTCLQVSSGPRRCHRHMQNHLARRMSISPRHARIGVPHRRTRHV